MQFTFTVTFTKFYFNGVVLGRSLTFGQARLAFNFVSFNLFVFRVNPDLTYAHRWVF
jgi:hypothetical protein